MCVASCPGSPLSCMPHVLCGRCSDGEAEASLLCWTHTGYDDVIHGVTACLWSFSIPECFSPLEISDFSGKEVFCAVLIKPFIFFALPTIPWLF